MIGPSAAALSISTRDCRRAAASHGFAAMQCFDTARETSAAIVGPA